MKTILIISLVIVAIQYLIITIYCYKYMPKNSTVGHLWKQIKESSIWLWIPFIGFLLWLIYIIGLMLKRICEFIKNIRIK